MIEISQNKAFIVFKDHFGKYFLYYIIGILGSIFIIILSLEKTHIPSIEEQQNNSLIKSGESSSKERQDLSDIYYLLLTMNNKLNKMDKKQIEIINIYNKLKLDLEKIGADSHQHKELNMVDKKIE